MADERQNDLLASVVSEVKSYKGKDPLMPWIRGIRRMRECLPAEVLKEKLPRFLQKCAQAFQEDRSYRNDLRYLRVWLQLMDYADNLKGILRTMEMNHIGLKRALFYQAYALYYEKMKKYDEAEKVYMTGVQNLAEPIDELQKSYDQFIHRMERHKKKKVQRQQARDDKLKLLNDTDNYGQIRGTKEKNEVKTRPMAEQSLSLKPVNSNNDSSAACKFEPRSTLKGRNSNITCGEDTFIGRFVDKAIVGKSEAEDARHHGLVEPTIHMKEAMDSINSMFREPLDPFINARKSQKRCPKVKDCSTSTAGLQVYVDGSADNSKKPMNPSQNDQKPFEIYIDADESSDTEHISQSKAHKNQNMVDSSVTSDSSEIPFPIIVNPPSDTSPDRNTGNPSRRKFREDTVVFRFVGSTTVDEPGVVENVCHHGLVEPTVNMKEAMDDINNMFGKPMDFVRSRRSKKQGKEVKMMENKSDVFSILPDDDPKTDTKGNSSGFLILQDEEQNPYNQGNSTEFLILPDDDLNPAKFPSPPKPAKSTRETELFEPTVFTKEAIDDINKMFGMPLDF